MTQQEFDELIYVSHPLERCRINQKELLETCPGDMVEFHRLILNYGNASFRYSDLASGQVTIEDYEHWLEGVPAHMADVFRKEGFEASRTTAPLRRHALERRDIGMDAYVAGLVRPEDLKALEAIRSS